MAELLVRAKSHWMDSFTQAQIDSLDESKKASRNARTQIGDIICVRPDGWTWGKEECLPTFIVARLPQYSVEDAKHFEEVLMDNTDPEHPVMLKRRKYRVPPNIVQQYVALGESVVTVELTQQQQNFINNVIEKTS